MPRIPDYNAQIDNQGATSRRTIESGAFDQITNPGLPWQALGKLGDAIQKVGGDMSSVVQAVARIHDQDANLYIQQKVEDQKSAMNIRITDIKNTPPGAENLDKIAKFKKDFSLENIPSLAGIVQSDQSSNLRDSVKTNGISDRHAAIYGMKMQNLTSSGLDSIVSDERKSREVQDIQIAQTQISNINYDILHNGLPIKQGEEQINSAYASKYNIIPESKIQLIKNDVGFAYKAYLEKAFDDGNAVEIKKFNTGEYDKQILDMPNGKETLGQLRDAGKKAGEYIQINEIYQSKAQDINKAVADEGVVVKAKEDIQGMKNVSQYVKDQAISKYQLNVNQLRESEKVDLSQKTAKEESAIYAALNSGNFNLTHELLNKAIYTPQEKKHSIEEAIKIGENPLKNYNPVVVKGLNERLITINPNTPQVEYDKLIADIKRSTGDGLPDTQATEMTNAANSKRSTPTNPDIVEHHKLISDWGNKFLYLNADQREIMNQMKTSGVTSRSEYTKNDAINSKGYLDTIAKYDGYRAEGKQPNEAFDLVVKSFNVAAGRSWLSKWFFKNTIWDTTNEPAIQPEAAGLKQDSNNSTKPKTLEEFNKKYGY